MLVLLVGRTKRSEAANPKSEIRNPKSERTTVEKMRATGAVVGKKGSNEASRLRRSPQTN